VDINPQPNYPFEFHRADALTFPTGGFDAIHASPPCQRYSTATIASGSPDRHPDLVAPIRLKLVESGLPYIIENVVGAPLIDPIVLCGSSFGLRVKRHRLFESNLELTGLPCDHNRFPRDIAIMNHGWTYTRFVPVYGSSGCKAREMWEEAMGIDWMTTKELTEAIPPAYTHHLGTQVMRWLEERFQEAS